MAKSLPPDLALVCAKATIDAGHKVGLVPAVTHTKIKKIKDDGVGAPQFECVEWYKNQSNLNLGEEQLPVPVYFDCNPLKPLHENWVSPITEGIQAINEAAPGLHLFKVRNESAAKIVVYGNRNGGCFTSRNIIVEEKIAEISLDSEWCKMLESQRRGTALHELMHALGFHHEHQRCDGTRVLTVDTSTVSEKDKNQFECLDYVKGLNRFDPHSIMMYSLGKELKRIPEGDPVWKTKVGDEQCQVLSELDKVGLNTFYPPVESERYKPQKSPETGLKYCGRKFINVEQRQIMGCCTNGVCGPTYGANCPACRVLKTDKIVEITQKPEGKWQGWTGLVYCGKKFIEVNGYHDGYCGPNKGLPCEECGKLLFPDYNLEWTAE